MHAVVGTTGFSDDDISSFRDAFKSSNCLIAANFAIGAVLMMKFAEQAAPYFETAEIIEFHHNAKADAPSGTAMATVALRRVSPTVDGSIYDLLVELGIELLPNTAGCRTVAEALGLPPSDYRDLVLEEKPAGVSREAAGEVLAEHAAASPARALDLDDDAVQGFLARVRSLAEWTPELALPAFDEAALAETARELAWGKRSFAEIRREPLLDALRRRLTHEQLRQRVPKAIGLIRTGDTIQYANMVLVSGR